MLGYFFIFCAFLALLQVVARLSLGRITRRHGYLILTLMILAYILYFAGTLLIRTIFSPPPGLHWHIPLLFALGPSIHYFLKFSLLPDEEISSRRIALQWFLPVLSLMYVASPFYPQRDLSLLDLLLAFKVKSHDTHDTLAITAFSVNIVYYVFNAWGARFLLKLPLVEFAGIRLYIIIFLIGSIITPVLAILGVAMHNIDLLSVSCILISLSIIFGYIGSIRYPEFFLPLQEVARNQKYQHSQLKGIDLGLLEDRLELFFREEKVWLDERLSVTRLARLLQITPHQLSEYINVRYAKSFSNLVNTHRIEEAQRRLRQEPEESIIEIAFASGFGTKSHFNSVFLKSVGMSPLQYRRAHAVQPPPPPRLRHTP